MNLEEFQELLEVHGADLHAWPTQEKRLAQRLLENSIEAQASLEKTHSLEQKLKAYESQGQASQNLRTRILIIPQLYPRPNIQRQRWWNVVFNPWRLGMTASTAALVIGFYMGMTGYSPDVFNAKTDSAYESVDLATLAYGTVIDQEIAP